MMKKKIIVTACVFGALAVIAGAFGAHGLEGKLSPKDMDVWHTAVQYQFYHVFALLFLSMLTRYKTRLVNDCYNLFTTGVIFFSGSLYLLSTNELTGWGWLLVLGPITPIGGLILIAGWIVLAVVPFKERIK